MRILIIVAISLLASCGVRSRCEKADAFVDGLCVLLNGSELRNAEISSSVQFAQDEYNKFFEDSLDLPNLLEKHEVSLKYRDWVDSKDASGTTQYTRWQITHPFNTNDFNRIDVVRTQVESCYNHIWIVGHELLHVIAQVHMEIPMKANKKHNVWGMFNCNTDEDNRFCDSAEYGIAAKAIEYCMIFSPEEFEDFK